MSVEKISGIYCIENAKNHKKYIGQSIDIYQRWYAHKSKLNMNKHHSHHLQQAWNKYGDNCFNFYIIETCDESLLNEREIYWIKYYNTYFDGYNETFGGEGYARQTRKVYQYSLSGEFIKEWNSVSEIENKLGYNGFTIRNVCNGDEHLSAYGYQWSYKKVDNIGQYYSVSQKKVVYQYNINGDLIRIYNSIYSVSEYGFSYSNVSKCCNGERITCGGYVWSYIELDKEYVKTQIFRRYRKSNIGSDNISISKYSLEGVFIEYVDNKDYFKKNNYNIYSILNCCDGNKDQYKNFQWRYGCSTNEIGKIEKNVNKKIPHKPRKSYRQAVLCSTTNMKFKSFADAEKYYGFCHGSLRNYFKNNAKYCGKLDSGEKLVWGKIS